MPEPFRRVYRFSIPPSGNRQVRTGQGRHYTPAWIVEYRETVYAERCAQEAHLPRMRPPIEVPVGVVLWIPKLRGDVDNREKTLWDAITKARIWRDDRLIQAKVVRMDRSLPKDRVVVVICDLESFGAEAGRVARRQAGRGSRHRQYDGGRSSTAPLPAHSES